MVLLRRVIGDALRSRRQSQHRTLREVSTAANVSLGYLSEIERGQKEASSELLAAICEALGARLSELLRDVSTTVASAEQVDGILAPVPAAPAARAAATSACTGPWAARSAGGTPARRTLRSVAYTISPPRKARLAPGTSTIVAASSPPVSDSATARVWPRARSAASTVSALTGGAAGSPGPRSRSRSRP